MKDAEGTGDQCPMCDVWREEDAEALKPSDRVLCWLIDRNNEKAGPQLWSMPLGVSRDISAASKVKSTGETLLIDDPDEGYDVFFDKEGQKDRTRYTHIEIDREPSPVNDNQKIQDKWLDYIADHMLPDMLKFYEPEYLDKVLSGQTSAREDEDDDGDSRDRGRGRSRGGDEREERPARSSRGRGRGEEEETETRPSRRGRAAEPEPEDESEAEPERGSRRRGRTEPEETPRGRGGRRRAPEPEGEPEGDGEGDEPAEETASPRGRGGGRERYRGREAEPEGEPEDEVGAARDRLKRVGKRGR
jgi:hypothetical protein